MCPDKHNHHVVIVPGLGDGGGRGGLLAKRLEREGMSTHIFRYPVREWKIDRAALMLATFVDTEVLQGDSARSVSFVGSGTGSLVERYYLSHYEVLPARRCVIVANPFHASDKYRRKEIGWLGRWRFGMVLPQLAEGPRGFPTHCGVPPIPFGVVITGTRLPPNGDRRDNAFIRESIYTPRYVLREARDVVYVNVSCPRAVGNEHVKEFISTFLQHGWFTQGRTK